MKKRTLFHNECVMSVIKNVIVVSYRPVRAGQLKVYDTKGNKTSIKWLFCIVMKVISIACVLKLIIFGVISLYLFYFIGLKLKKGSHSFRRC